MITHLGEVCVGLKQSKKAVMNGEAEMIYLAHDADRNIKETFEKLCKKAKSKQTAVIHLHNWASFALLMQAQLLWQF